MHIPNISFKLRFDVFYVMRTMQYLPHGKVPYACMRFVQLFYVTPVLLHPRSYVTLYRNVLTLIHVCLL
jgi:hypothetical protein